MPRKYRDDDLDDEDEADEAPGGNDQYADGEGEPCPNCGRLYRWVALAGLKLPDSLGHHNKMSGRHWARS